MGLGEVGQMVLDDKVQEAIRRGGAEGVMDKIGMEGKLNRLGIPDMTSGGGDIEFVSDLRNAKKKEVATGDIGIWRNLMINLQPVFSYLGLVSSDNNATQNLSPLLSEKRMLDTPPADSLKAE